MSTYPIELNLLDGDIFHFAKSSKNSTDHALRDRLRKHGMERHVDLSMRRRSRLHDGLVLHDGGPIFILNCPAESKENHKILTQLNTQENIRTLMGVHEEYYHSGTQLHIQQQHVG